jgi:hypothetical protein
MDDKAGLHVPKYMHAGSRKHWKGRTTAARKSGTAKKRSKPAPDRNSSQAWATALLKALPKPFQNLAARWGFIACDKQHSPPLSPVSGSWQDTNMSHHYQAGFPDWAYRSSDERVPELQLHLDLSSLSTDKSRSKQLAIRPMYRTTGSSLAKKGRSDSMDLQSNARRSASTGGKYSASCVVLKGAPLQVAVGVVLLC